MEVNTKCRRGCTKNSFYYNFHYLACCPALQFFCFFFLVHALNEQGDWYLWYAQGCLQWTLRVGTQSLWAWSPTNTRPGPHSISHPAWDQWPWTRSQSGKATEEHKRTVGNPKTPTIPRTVSLVAHSALPSPFSAMILYSPMSLGATLSMSMEHTPQVLEIR